MDLGDIIWIGWNIIWWIGIILGYRGLDFLFFFVCVVAGEFRMD